MKKVKIFLLIITILLMIVFIFATCKKTKAYTYSYTTPLLSESYNLYSGEGFSYIFSSDFSSESFVFSFKQGNEIPYLLDFYRSSGNLYVAIYNRQGSVESLINISAISTNNLFYLQFLYDYDLEELYLYFSPITFTISNRQDDSPIISSIGLSSNGVMFEITDPLFISNYTSNQSIITINLYYSAYPNDKLIGFQQLYMFNIINQLSQDVEEQLDFIWTDLSTSIPITFYNSLINTYYYQGYNAGYNSGYNVGYTTGQNAGYNNGYLDGVSDGMQAGQPEVYQAGYDEGFENGYNTGLHYNDAYQVGWNAGYDNGYNVGYGEGYDAGYIDGQDGTTAFTPAFNVLSGVFDVVGSVMSINLVPGIPIGLFILVPLFFAVIGLVLWIWRKNG